MATTALPERLTYETPQEDDDGALVPSEAPYAPNLPTRVAPHTPTPPAAFQWNQDELDALRATVAKECNPAQFKVFIVACQRLQLDPFARQIVPIVQDGRMTPQTTIDGFRLISQRTGMYAGIIGPFWCGNDGVWHDVWLLDSDPIAAKVGIRRRDFSEPVWGVARTRAYKKGNPTWTKMPDVMIAKVAESLARRIAFPQELSGVYTAEEMEQSAHELITPPTAYVEQAAPAVDRRKAVDPDAEAHPATPTQRNAIGKLCVTLGKATPMEPLSFDEARQLIAQLSEEYQRRKRSAAAKPTPAPRAQTAPDGAYPGYATDEPQEFDLREHVGNSRQEAQE